MPPPSPPWYTVQGAFPFASFFRAAQLSAEAVRHVIIVANYNNYVLYSSHGKTNQTHPQRVSFIKEYAIDFNGKAAYMRATGETNGNNASRNATYYLKKDVVQNALNDYIQEQLGPH